MECKCTIQYAGYAFDQYDDQGLMTYQDLMALFDAFPWTEQWQIGARTTTGCAATISAEQDDETLWVSIATVDGEPVFLLGYVYPKMVKSWLGLGKLRQVKWVDIYEATSIEIKYYYQLFFDAQTHRLKTELARLTIYESLNVDDL
jgi:hypothetical protein